VLFQTQVYLTYTSQVMNCYSKGFEHLMLDFIKAATIPALNVLTARVTSGAVMEFSSLLLYCDSVDTDKYGH